MTRISPPVTLKRNPRLPFRPQKHAWHPLPIHKVHKWLHGHARRQVEAEARLPVFLCADNDVDPDARVVGVELCRGEESLQGGVGAAEGDVLGAEAGRVAGEGYLLDGRELERGG